jgi:MFS family permease
LLWLARTLSAVGDALVPVATAFAVLEIGSASDLGLVLAAAIVSRAVFLMVGGVWADRLPRRLVMIGADAIRAAVQLVIAVAFLTGEIEVWQLVVSAVLFGAAASFFNPASTGLLPQLVPARRIQEANALVRLSQSVTHFFGPVAAGILIATVGYDVIYAIDAATVLASLTCLALMRPLGRVRTRTQSFLADAREGIRAVLARPWMRVTIIVDCFANLALAPYFVLGPLVVLEHLDGPPDWGLMMAASAAGGIAGGALVLRWKPQRPLIPAYVFLLAAPLALLSLVPPLPLPLLMLASLLFAMALVVGNTFWTAMAQQHVPQELLGRVDSVAWTGSVLIMPVGYALAGPLAEWIGVREALLAAAAVGIACHVSALLSRSVRELRRLDDEAVVPPAAPRRTISQPAGDELPPPASAVSRRAARSVR